MSGNAGTSTNGASLEDCHTNVFVLTELAGLSWKKFVTPSDQHARGGYAEAGEDPILRAYGRCLSEGLLCVWRRAPLHDRSAPTTGPSHIDLRLPTEKELFVFWYADEPEILKTLTSSLTNNPECKGSWEKNNVEYEIRTLLFKALHNLIERYVLTKGFVRLGKWFIQPLDSEISCNEQQKPNNYILAFNFTFFVHGESNVCVCVNTQRQPPVLKISRRHLTQEREQEVIVAPWSLKGTINPATYQSDLTGAIGKLPERQQTTANKQWKEWKCFYPLPEKDNKENLGYVDPVEKEMQERANAMALPQMLEVTVGGARMYFPTGFVLVVATEDSVLDIDSSFSARVKQSPGKKSSPVKQPPSDSCSGEELKHGFKGSSVIERATEELLLCRKSSSAPSLTEHDPSPAPTSSDEPRWEFRESVAIDTCGCKLGTCPPGSCTVTKPSPTPVLSKAALKFGAGNQQRTWDKQKVIRSGPFHRRSPLTVLEEGRQPVMGGNLENPPSSTPIPPTPNSVMTPSCSSSAIATPMMGDVSCGMGTQNGLGSQGGCVMSLSLNTAIHTRHVPETQMISPANSAPPPQQEQDHRKTQNEMTGMDNLNSAEVDVIVRPGIRKQTDLCPIKVVKRRKLDDLDSVVDELSIEAKERLECNSLYPSIEERLSLWHESAQKRKFANEQDSPQSFTEVELLPIAEKGLLSGVRKSEDFGELKEFLKIDEEILRSGETTGLESTLQKPDEFAIGRTHETDLAMPDNIMAEDQPQIISPPASHENDVEQFCTASIGPAGAKKSTVTISKTLGVGIGAQSRHGGPPSVGEYTKIYPTPPSLDPPCHQFSPPEMPYLATVTGSMVKPESFSPTIGRNNKLSYDDEKDEKTIFDHPKLGRYLASSKFFGTTAFLKDRKNLGSSKCLPMEYKPRLTTPALTPPKTPLIVAQAQSIFETQPNSSGVLGRVGGPPGPQALWSNQVRPQRPFTPTGGRPGPSPYTCPQQSPSPLMPPSVYASMQRTPGGGPMDVHSPLSQADSSTPYGRTLNSVESWQTGAEAGVPEAHSLVVTLLLSDTFVDIHRDSSFDSCPVCACQSPCNIRGLEMGVYVTPLPSISNRPNLAPRTGSCTCGFSAVRHRYLSSKAGLFLEDELEATNCDNFQQSSSHPRVDIWGLELIRQQSLVTDLRKSLLGPSCVVNHPGSNQRGVVVSRHSTGNGEFVGNGSSGQWSFKEDVVSLVEWRDLNNLCNSALEAACMVIGDGTAPARSQQDMEKEVAVHKWGYRRNELGSETTDIESLGVIRCVSEVLEGALRNQHVTGTLESSLTWRSFERKCYSRGAGHEDTCQPEPIPQILLTNEKDSLSVAPQSLRLWDGLLYEPYSQPKDVLYVAVIPDSPMVINSASKFFRELSKTYENFKFGRHCPLLSSLRDGLIRVGKDKVKDINTPDPQETESQDFAKAMGLEKENWNRIYAYTKQCRDYALVLKDEAFNRDSLANVKENQAPVNEAMPPPPAPAGPTGVGEIQSEATAAGESGGDGENETGTLPYILVVYMVNPIILGAENQKPEMAKFVTRTLLRCFLRMVNEFPQDLRQRIQLQIIPIQTVLECAPYSNCDPAEQGGGLVRLDPDWGVWAGNRERIGAAETMKTLAIEVYSQTRSLTVHCLLGTQAKSLTGFGPGAMRFDSIAKRLKSQEGLLYKSFCTPFVLASSTGTGKKRNTVAGDFAVTGSLCSGSMLEDSNVLFVSYCLSEDGTGAQNWLLATATDHRGRILENCLISLAIKNSETAHLPVLRKHAAHGQVIRQALNQLWGFVESVLALGCHPWRLVVGRLGRLGHSELKEWARLLSKGNLKTMKNILCHHCSQCSQMPGYHETPAILSACLISTEPESNLRVFTRKFTHDERFGQTAKQCPLSTPEDTSSTHILVFPTSATISPNAGPMTAGLPEEQEELFSDFPDLAMEAEMDELINVMDAPTSAGLWNRSGLGTDGGSEDLALQPLALGYYLSTAPANGLPSWFWTNCPSARKRCPVHLKSALHLNISRVQESDEFSLDGSLATRTGMPQFQHSLDSKLTTDVLRYVLETYNALSWLNVDMSSGDRRSCLPVHIQALLRLYHSVGALV